MPDNRGEVVKVLPGRDASTRVAIVRRTDGYYEIRPERWYENVFEGEVIWAGWVPVFYRSGVFASVALAETEAYSDSWARPFVEMRHRSGIALRVLTGDEIRIPEAAERDEVE
jgi:hypothetical protein